MKLTEADIAEQYFSVWTIGNEGELLYPTLDDLTVSTDEMLEGMMLVGKKSVKDAIDRTNNKDTKNRMLNNDRGDPHTDFTDLFRNILDT